MIVQFDVTSTKTLKVTVTKDNNIRFKVPKNEQQYYPFETLAKIANQILEIPRIVDHKISLRGSLYDVDKIPLYEERNYTGKRVRNHIYTVFYRG